MSSLKSFYERLVEECASMEASSFDVRLYVAMKDLIASYEKYPEIRPLYAPIEGSQDTSKRLKVPIAQRRSMVKDFLADGSMKSYGEVYQHLRHDKNLNVTYRSVKFILKTTPGVRHLGRGKGWILRGDSNDA